MYTSDQRQLPFGFHFLLRFSAAPLLLPLMAYLILASIACTAPAGNFRAIDPAFTLPQAENAAPSLLNRKILARGDHSYAPFEFLDEAGRPAGFNVDLLLRVGAIMNLDMDIDLGPWDEVRGQLERAEIDMLPGMYKTMEREKAVDFTIPHFISSYGIFAKSGSQIRSAADLAGSRVAVQQGDVGHDYLREQNLAGEIVISNSWEDIFIAVLEGEADCAVASMVQGSQLLQDKRYSSLRQVGPPLIQQRYCMAVSKGDAPLLAALNEGLSILKATGEYDYLYEKWFGVYEEGYIRSQRLYRNLRVSLGVALVLSLSILLWSTSLRRQVNLKTLALTRELALNEETRGKLALALKEAERSRVQAEEASKAKTVFLASISHELRTPLHGVIGISELLKRSELNEDQKNLLGLLSGAAGQLERLITDLLELNRFATGSLSLNPGAFRLGELADWMEEPLRRRAEARGLTLGFTIRDPGLRIMADKDRLAQIVENLVSNSIKFTEQGKVLVSIEAEAEKLAITVSDTGRGIPASERDRVFEAFYRLDTEQTGGLHGGLGLGLSIVRLLVQRMEGEISLTSQEGVGTVFSVLLPYTPASPELEGAEDQGPSAPESADSQRAKRCGRSVLIVEDEAINRLYIRRIMDEQGLKTTGVGDGLAAVEAAGKEKFDLILMDMGLPKLSGLDATLRIRQAEIEAGKPRTPIAALTANAYPQDREDCLKAGMDDFISKPFNEQNLWTVVDRLLESSFKPSSAPD